MDEDRNRLPDRRAKAIALLLEQTARLVYDEKQPKDLHAVQWSALRFLERAGESSRTVAGIARYLGVTSGPASRTAASLVARGLARMEESPVDSRSKVIHLTDLGHVALLHDPLNRCASVLEELSEEESAALANALNKLHARLTDRED